MEIERRGFLKLTGIVFGSLGLASCGSIFDTDAPLEDILLEEARGGDRKIRQAYLNQFLRELRPEINRIVYIDETVEDEVERYSELMVDIDALFTTDNFGALAKMVIYPVSVADESPIPFTQWDVALQHTYGYSFGEMQADLLVGSFLFEAPTIETPGTYVMASDVDVRIVLKGHEWYHAWQFLHFDTDDTLQFYARQTVETGFEIRYMLYTELVAGKNEIEFIAKNGLQRQVNPAYWKWLNEQYTNAYIVLADTWNFVPRTEEESPILHAILLDNFHPVLHGIEFGDGSRLIIEDEMGNPKIYNWFEGQYIDLPPDLVDTEQYQINPYKQDSRIPSVMNPLVHFQQEYKPSYVNF